jgi:hypothetical protein
MAAFRAGDTVFHRPSGETWVLSCDEVEGEVIPAGWPESYANAEDCDLVESASDTERLEMLTNASKSRTDYGQTTIRSRRAHYQLNGSVA